MSQGMLGALRSLKRTLLLPPSRSPFVSSSIRSISHEERLYQTDIYLKRNGRVSFEGFLDLQRSPKITPDRALLLFRCCGSLLPDLTPSRRHELMLDLKTRFKPPFIDISHFNTLLLVQNENGVTYSPSEALSECEALGLTPNRVTYQHLIERYALMGDLESANAILSHMKESGMPVNEWIFGSLISCHCVNGDFEGAKGVMELMQQSGLEVGSEAHITYILGVLKHRAKDITSQELGELFQDAKLKEISFCDHDVFQVLARASALDRIDLAPEIISYLPRKSGYYQEMRNHIPGLVFNGHVDVAVSLFQDFAQNIQQDDTGLSKRVGGDFIAIAMVRSNGKYSAKDIEEVVDKLMCDNQGYIFAETLSACIEEGHMELSKSLGEIMQARRLFDRRNFIPYIKRKTRSINGKEGNVLKEMTEFLSCLVSAGIFPSMQSYSQDILPPIIASRTTMEGRTSNVVRDLLNAVKESTGRMPPYSDLANACIQYHLNLEKEESFREALRMLSFIRTEWVLPISWKISLAKSYLATNDMNVLAGFFFFCLRNQFNKGDLMDRNLAIWDTIPLIHSLAPKFHHDKDPDHILRDVIAHLASCKITPPKDVSSSWKRNVEDPSVREMIDGLSEPHTWTPEEDKKFNADIFSKIFGSPNLNRSLGILSDSRRIHESLIKSIAEEKFAEGAERILKVIKSSDFVIAPREVHDLILGLCQSQETHKALELFRAVNESNENSKIFAATAAHLLGHLLSRKDDAWKGLLQNTLQVNKLITKPGVSLREYFSSLSLHLDEASKKEKLDEVKSVLIEKGIVDSSFKFMEEDKEYGRHLAHGRIVDLIAQNKSEEGFQVLKSTFEKGEVVYGGTCIQMGGALAKGSYENLKEFLLLLSEERVHARQTWNGYLISLLNHIVDHLDDTSKGYTLLEDLLEAGAIPSNNCKAYYNTKAALLIKENKIDEALEVLLEAGEHDVLIKNQEMMKIFAESEDLEKLQKVLDVAIGILGEVNALYSLIRCFLDLSKYPQVKKLLETPGFRYMPSNVENLVEYLIRCDNIQGLEHFVNYSRNLFACDRDFLYSKLLSVCPKETQGDKASEIWINLQEEGHIPSLELKKQIARSLRSSNKYVPFTEEGGNSSASTKKRAATSPLVTDSLLKSLSEKKSDPLGCLDFIMSLEESERSKLLSSKAGIKVFAEVLRSSNSEVLTKFESFLSEDLNKLFFIPKRKMESLIVERKVDLVDSVRENPSSIPSVKVLTQIADVEGLHRLYALKDTLTDTGKAIVATAALLKGEFSLVKDFMNSSTKEDKSYQFFKRYIKGNMGSISESQEFLASLKSEGLIAQLGGPIYSHLLEVNPNISSSKDELANVLLELSRNRVDLNSMSTSALRICGDVCEDEVMKKNINHVIAIRSKA